MKTFWLQNINIREIWFKKLPCLFSATNAVSNLTSITAFSIEKLVTCLRPITSSMNLISSSRATAQSADSVSEQAYNKKKNFKVFMGEYGGGEGGMNSKLLGLLLFLFFLVALLLIRNLQLQFQLYHCTTVLYHTEPRFQIWYSSQPRVWRSIDGFRCINPRC